MSIKYEVYKYNNEILGENTLNYLHLKHSRELFSPYNLPEGFKRYN